jgi:hypothetical protein
MDYRNWNDPDTEMLLMGLGLLAASEPTGCFAMVVCLTYLSLAFNYSFAVLIIGILFYLLIRPNPKSTLI